MCQRRKLGLKVVVVVLIRINIYLPIINSIVKLCYPITIVVFKVLMETLQIGILFKMANVQNQSVNCFMAEADECFSFHLRVRPV